MERTRNIQRHIYDGQWLAKAKAKTHPPSCGLQLCALYPGQPDFQACPYCGNVNETIPHMVLQCPRWDKHRRQTLNELVRSDSYLSQMVGSEPPSMEFSTTLLYQGERPIKALCEFLKRTQRTRESDHFSPGSVHTYADESTGERLPPPCTESWHGHEIGEASTARSRKHKTFACDISYGQQILLLR